MGIHAASYLPLPHWLVRDGALRARLLLAMAVLLLALLPSTAYAAEPRSGDSVIVGPNEVIADDLYAFGSTIEIQGTVRGDVIAFGNSVIVSGTVTGDLIAAGATVTVSGRVDGSIRAAGATVIVNGAVGEDVVAAGRSLNIGRTSTIGRDLLMASESALVEGTVGRKLTGGVGNLTLAGAVNGDVQVDVSNLSLTSTAVVGGNLTYTSDNEASIAQGAEVRGSVERRAPERQQRERAENRAAPIIGWFQSLIGLFLTGLLFVLLLPGFSRRTADTLRASPWASLGLGFLLFLLVPPVAFILFVIGLFLGGWWIGLILLFLYAVALLLGFVIAGLCTGQWVVERVGRPNVPILVSLAIGLAILLLLAVVPFLGPIVVAIATFFGLGALFLALWRARRSPEVAATQES